jgi:hypothetical protein
MPKNKIVKKLAHKITHNVVHYTLSQKVYDHLCEIIRNVRGFSSKIMKLSTFETKSCMFFHFISRKCLYLFWVCAFLLFYRDGFSSRWCTLSHQFNTKVIISHNLFMKTQHYRKKDDEMFSYRRTYMKNNDDSCRVSIFSVWLVPDHRIFGQIIHVLHTVYVKWPNMFEISRIARQIDQKSKKPIRQQWDPFKSQIGLYTVFPKKTKQTN